MDVVLGGNAGGAHTALNQTVADLEALRAKVEQINSAFKTMQKNLTSVKSLLGSLAGASGNVTNNIVNNNQRIDNSIRNTTNNITNMSDTANRTSARTEHSIKSMIKSFMGLYAVGKVFSFVKQSMISGMDMIESESLFETSLDNMADNARQWSEELSQQLGLNAVELRKNVGILYTMTSSMGLADNTAYDVSLAGFDEINTLSFDTDGENLVNLDTDDVDDYSDALDDLGSQINSIPDIDIDMPDLSEYDLGSLFNFSGLENIKNRFLEFVEDTFGTEARNKIDDFFYTLELIPDAASQMFNDMMNDGGIFNPDSKFWKNWHTGFEDIKSGLYSFGEWYEESFESIFGNVGEWWISLLEDVGGKLFDFKEKWTGVFEDIGSGIFEMKEEWDWWFSEMGKSWEKFWEDRGADFFSWAENLKVQLDMIAEAIKSVFSGEVFDEDFSVAGYFGKIVAGNSSAVRGYATGGFPDYGELFIARENGIPELVGTMGNSAAVANNMQIVEGISQGVYEAVTSAIQQNSSKDSGNITIPVYLFRGSQEMTRIIAGASQRYQSMTGGYI